MNENEPLLVIEDLTVAIDVEDEPILKGLNLTIEAGEIHAIMGPNGSGKSTLSHVLAGHPRYRMVQGRVRFLGCDLLTLEPEERAVRGLFLAFQHPIAIPGMNTMYFLKEASTRLRKQRGETPLDAIDFIARARAGLKQVGLDESFLKRALNDDFSGGEKKRNEMLQMLLLEPTLAVLDEIDSGLDIDALQCVARVVYHMKNTKRSWLLITHYNRLLEHIKPDYVHVLRDGRFIQTGDHTLALKLEQKGYGWLTGAQA